MCVLSAFDSCRNLFDAAARWQRYCCVRGCLHECDARALPLYMCVWRGFINTRLICSTHMWLSACAAECRRLAGEKPLEPKPHARSEINFWLNFCQAQVLNAEVSGEREETLAITTVEWRGCFCSQILRMRYLTSGCRISSLRLELLSSAGMFAINTFKTSTMKEAVVVTKVEVLMESKTLFLNNSHQNF